jgi:hypothetical protein
MSDRLRNAAGNFYINDKPTAAVVGQQPFGGGRASGTNDKAGSAMNLLRWMSVRTLKETFAPPKNWRVSLHGRKITRPHCAHFRMTQRDGPDDEARLSFSCQDTLPGNAPLPAGRPCRAHRKPQTPIFRKKNYFRVMDLPFSNEIPLFPACRFFSREHGMFRVIHVSDREEAQNMYLSIQRTIMLL